MAKARDIEVSAYCDRVYDDLSCMKEKLLGLVKEIETMTGTEKEMLKPHIRHFEDIAGMIDWKMEILMKVCPLDYTRYGGEVERTPLFLSTEETPGKEFTAGGYIGG